MLQQTSATAVHVGSHVMPSKEARHTLMQLEEVRRALAGGVSHGWSQGVHTRSCQMA